MPSAPKSKVLYVCHNHPAITPGGAEEYALQVYKGMRDARELDSVFLARSGPPVSITARMHEGRPITMVNDDPNQYFFYTDLSDWDWTFGRSPNKSALTRFFADFLVDQAPDVVHFQHSLFLGYEIAARHAQHAARRADRLHAARVPADLPPRRTDGADGHRRALHGGSRRGAATSASPTSASRRSSCASASSSRTCRSSTCSSRRASFLRERYIDWGIPPERIRVRGRTAACRAATRAASRRDRRAQPLRLLRPAQPVQGRRRAAAGDGAARRATTSTRTCAPRREPRLQPEEFQDEFASCSRRRRAHDVTLVGRYEHDRAAAADGARSTGWSCPSIWWENSPLVIQEAFQHGRPVICSDIGGMAEKVTDGVNGLHFRAGDPDSLAEAHASRGDDSRACGRSCAPAARRSTTCATTSRRCADTYARCCRGSRSRPEHNRQARQLSSSARIVTARWPRATSRESCSSPTTTLRSGPGIQGYASRLYEEMRDQGEFEPCSWRAAGLRSRSPSATTRDGPSRSPTTTPTSTSSTPTPRASTALYGRSPHKSALTRFYSEFLLDQQPDLVHFHHTLFLGYDILRVTRNTLPDVPIVYTLHDYTADLPPGRPDGEGGHRAALQRGVAATLSRVLPRRSASRPSSCVSASSSRSSRPWTSSYAERGRAASATCELGNPARQHRARASRPAADRCDRGRETSSAPRNRFGFFGQLTAYKGAEGMLEAMSTCSATTSTATLSDPWGEPRAGRPEFQDRLEPCSTRRTATCAFGASTAPTTRRS